jgi:hypothetical protein
MSAIGKSFSIDEIHIPDDLVVVVLSGNFTKLISDQLMECRNPAVQALAHCIKQGGQILSGHRKPEDYPHLKDAVVTEEDVEYEEKHSEDLIPALA